jgi:hypothetical protein
MGSIEPACAPNQRVEIGERGNHYIYRLQIALGVQFAERLGVELDNVPTRNGCRTIVRGR